MKSFSLTFILTFILILFSSSIFAQVQFKLEIFEEDKLIKSLDEVLYVVRQEYAVRGPDSLLYGNNGNEYYDVAYGPAIMVKGNLIINKYTYFPYLKDASFRSLGQNYVPEPTKTMLKKVGDTTYTILQNDSASVKTKAYSVQIPTGDSVSINHDMIAEPQKEMDCIIITFLNADSTLTENSIFEYSFTETKVSWKSDGSGTLEAQDLGNDTKFGLLFYEHTGFGSASLSFGGFVEKTGAGNWRALEVEQPIIEPKDKKKEG